MLKFPPRNRSIQWETFTVQDKFAKNFNIPTSSVIPSQGIIDLITSNVSWSGVRNVNPNSGEFEIGYGIGDPDKQQGYTEEEAYAEWVGFIRNEQRKLQIQLLNIVVGINQTTFDALLSLYIDTGTWRTLEAQEGTYDLASAVKSGNQNLIADILSRGNVNPELRRSEARVVNLADYTYDKSRNQQYIQGVQRLRKSYVNGISNEFEKKQAEFVYYRQLGSFLPGMSQLRQRRIVAQSTPQSLT
jgi:hypothetical protein